VEVIEMKKSTVTRTWLGGLVVQALGLLIIGLGVVLMLAYGGTFSQAASGSGYDFVPSYGGVFWTTIVLIVAGAFGTALGGIVGLVAWIGALVNTFQIQDKTWFAVVLAGGVLGFAFALIGFAAMVAYVIAGPDGMAFRQPQVAPPAYRPSALAPTS
jgi:hypothetical protein